jgi:hypothetical protein
MHMANIEKNLTKTARLARRIANSSSKWKVDWKSMMGRIYGSRSAQAGISMLEDAAGTARAVPIGASTIGVGGLGFWGLIAVILAALFFISLLFVYLMPLWTDVPPSTANDAIRSAPSDEALRGLQREHGTFQTPQTGNPLTPSQQLNKAIFDHEGAFPGMLPDQRTQIRAATPTETLNEGKLQADRVAAAHRGIEEFNRLVEQQKNLYRQHGKDPCASAFFPQSLCQ